MFKRELTVYTFLAMMLALLTVMPASAVPIQPSGFWGYVTIDGNVAPAGTNVTASINGVQYVQAATFISNGQALYVFNVPSDDSDTPQIIEGGVAGDTIVFKIDGQNADQTGTWQTATNIQLDLTSTSTAPTPTPLPSPTPSPTPLATATATPIPSGAVILALDPATVTVSMGESFEWPMMVQADESQSVDSVSAYVNFDPTVLQVASITAGDSLPTVLQNEFDNTTGHINFSAGAFVEFPAGTFTLATVTFNTIATTAGSTLAFNSVMPRQSQVTWQGASVLSATESGTAVISDPSNILGSISLQGRPSPPDSRWSVPISVTLTLPGESAPAYTFSTTTDESGNFTVEGIDADTYEIGIKKSSTLQVMQVVTLVGGDNTLDFGMLREGDANNNNLVNILDFSILAATFAKCEGMADYDARADFNGDTCITVLDFSLLTTNFGLAGEGTQATANTPSRLPNGAELSLIPDSTTIAPGERFNVTVQLDAGSQKIDGAQLNLNFDTAYLQVEQLSAEANDTLPSEGAVEHLPLDIISQFDNQRGTIDFAAGTFENFPSGTINLITIQFRALAPVAQTQLAFQFNAPRTSNITFAGSSVLGDHSDATLTINQPTSITLEQLTAPTTNNWLWILAPLGLTLLAGVWMKRRRHK